MIYGTHRHHLVSLQGVLRKSVGITFWEIDCSSPVCYLAGARASLVTLGIAITETTVMKSGAMWNYPELQSYLEVEPVDAIWSGLEPSGATWGYLGHSKHASPYHHVLGQVVPRLANQGAGHLAHASLYHYVLCQVVLRLANTFRPILSAI